MMGHTAMGRELAPYLAEMSEAGLVSDCIAIEVANNQLLYTRPLYAGKVLAMMTIDTAVHYVTLRPNLFPMEQAV
jgi:electron transfer flavoprotein alpha subunit